MNEVTAPNSGPSGGVGTPGMFDEEVLGLATVAAQSFFKLLCRATCSWNKCY